MLLQFPGLFSNKLSLSIIAWTQFFYDIQHNEWTVHKTVADLEISKGRFSYWHAKRTQKILVATPTFGHVKVQTEYLEATDKRLEISKELIREW